MIAYPHVINHKGKKYMFYNGNDYGKEGVFLASEVKNKTSIAYSYLDFY